VEHVIVIYTKLRVGSPTRIQTIDLVLAVASRDLVLARAWA
jgi:hypothetical protein